ncbi:MAG: hypothetical protein JWQ97_987 [Phenylobacterium sp.]|nr:hypothetical protein [Phenylobacterium sp.]
MKERPILFSSAMVRALLAGTKTQTRRAVKPQPDWLPEVGSTRRTDGLFWPIGSLGQQCGSPLTKCPYGVPGDRLWVRESGLEHRRVRLFTHDATPGRWWTDEDGGRYGASYSDAITRQMLLRDHRVRPSIHMPRWASRITLQVTDVRVERLQACSEDDARAEGALHPSLGEWVETGLGSIPRDGCPAITAYAGLWEQINGPGSWAANPFVWAISFEVVAA